MNKPADEYFLNKPEPQQGCLLALRDIVLALDSNIELTMKYGMPCFCYHTKPLCYLWIDKDSNSPYLLMVDGLKLKHPGLIQGNRTSTKIFMVDPNTDLQIDTINALLQEALVLCKAKVKKAKNQ